MVRDRTLEHIFHQNAAPLRYFLNSLHYAIATTRSQLREIARNSPTTVAVSRFITRILSLLFCMSYHGTVTVTNFNFCDRRQLPRDEIVSDSRERRKWKEKRIFSRSSSRKDPSDLIDLLSAHVTHVRRFFFAPRIDRIILTTGSGIDDGPSLCSSCNQFSDLDIVIIYHSILKKKLISGKNRKRLIIRNSLAINIIITDFLLTGK